MQLSVLFSRSKRTVLQVAIESNYEHEMRLFHSIHNDLLEKDILVYDRAGGHFVGVARLSRKNVELISRVFKRRIDWRSGRPRGKHDRLFFRKRRSTQPAYLNQEQSAALPEDIPVRVLKVTVNQKGCGTQGLTLVTNLLDPVKYTAQKVAEAYLCRLRLKLCWTI